MAQAQRTDHIQASRDEVFRALGDPRTWPTWHPHFRSAVPSDAADPGVGTHWQMHSTRIGDVDVVIVAYEPGRRIASEAATRMATIRHSYALDSGHSGGTLVHQIATATPHNIRGRLLTPLLMRKSVKDNAAALRRHLAMLPRTPETSSPPRRA